jgi:hypothetical protein
LVYTYTTVRTILSINFYEGRDSLENIPPTQRVEIQREGFDCLKTIVEKFEERLTARHAKQIAARCGYLETVTIRVPGGFGKGEKQEKKQAAVRKIPLNARDGLQARRYRGGRQRRRSLAALLIFQVIAESLVKVLAEAIRETRRSSFHQPDRQTKPRNEESKT